MKSLKFKSPSSSIAASYIDSLNNRLKKNNKTIASYSIHILNGGKTSVILYF